MDENDEHDTYLSPFALESLATHTLERNYGPDVRCLRDLLWQAYSRMVRSGSGNKERAHAVYEQYNRLDRIVDQWDKEG